jgi:curli biogenesis system outer membrane secretion channel CsgG
MTNTPSLSVVAVAALLALAACDSKPTTVVAGDDDPQAEQLKNAAAVAPPPMIQASRTYRCDDNSLVYADFYTNNTVAVRSDKAANPTVLTAAEGKPPYVAEGYSVSANAASIRYAAPGKPAQGCDAK